MNNRALNGLFFNLGAIVKNVQENELFYQNIQLNITKGRV